MKMHCRVRETVEQTPRQHRFATVTNNAVFVKCGALHDVWKSVWIPTSHCMSPSSVQVCTTDWPVISPRPRRHINLRADVPFRSGHSLQLLIQLFVSFAVLIFRWLGIITDIILPVHVVRLRWQPLHWLSDITGWNWCPLMSMYQVHIIHTNWFP